ncbi:hypothetical protein LA080_001400 [Diaporthe eres]|nr:hypothetical protein LA080_001400 [Diaporthe eres]
MGPPQTKLLDRPGLLKAGVAGIGLRTRANNNCNDSIQRLSHGRLGEVVGVESSLKRYGRRPNRDSARYYGHIRAAGQKTTHLELLTSPRLAPLPLALSHARGKRRTRSSVVHSARKIPHHHRLRLTIWSRVPPNDSVGWRWGFRATSILNIVVLAIALWSLPASVDDDAPLGRATLIRLQKELDWVGVLVISASLAFLSYVLAVVADSDASIHMRAPLNIAVALLLSYLNASYAVPVACFVSGLAPLLLTALCRVNGPSYWQAVFQATALNPLGADLMCTIAMLVTTEAFPLKTQVLAGGVFNMVSQIGKSVGSQQWLS